MRERIYVIGVGMTKIVKMAGSYESMCAEAIREAMEDAGLSYEGNKGAMGASGTAIALRACLPVNTASGARSSSAAWGFNGCRS